LRVFAGTCSMCASLPGASQFSVEHTQRRSAMASASSKIIVRACMRSAPCTLPEHSRRHAFRSATTPVRSKYVPALAVSEASTTWYDGSSASL